MDVMEIFKNARKFCRHYRESFNRQVTVLDTSINGQKFLSMDRITNVVRVKYPNRKPGTLRFLKREDLVRFVLCAEQCLAFVYIL